MKNKFNENITCEPIVKLENITKSFGKVNALKGVNLRAFEGKVMAILGENGAGKSTLMNILSGFYPKTSGKFLLRNEEINLKSIKHGESFGITIIHQEIVAVPEMTVVDNIFLGHEILNIFGLINYREEKRVLKKIFLELSLDISPTELMGNLTIAEQQMLEIAKSVLKNSKIIIMDEPTSSLSDKETNNLFKVIRKLKSENKAILYISHRLQEIPIICDYITIIRDGEYIGEHIVGEISENNIIKDMVGREISQQFPEKFTSKVKNKILSIDKLESNILKSISFEVYTGEILGFSGLVGSRRTELFKTIIGLLNKNEGRIMFDNKFVNFKNPNNAIKNGFYYVTEDRKVEGLQLDETISKNITISSLNRISKFGFLDFKKEKLISTKYFNSMRIKAPGVNTIVGNMSGGNQQKVLIGKGLCAEPKLIVFDEPTRGVDVGARREIYDLIIESKKRGIAIVVISSDLPEVVGLCDRVLVMKSGKISQEITENITQENIMQYAI